MNFWDKGYPAFILNQDGLFKVQVGAYQQLGNAVTMERRLREDNLQYDDHDRKRTADGRAGTQL